MNKKFFLVFLFFSFIFVLSAQEVTTIKILNSQKTEYKKDPVLDNETIVLEGAVELSVTKGNVKTNVTADTVSYDRKTKMLFAKGNIHLTTEGSAAGDENVTADSLIMNTATLEGVFDGGKVIQTQSDAINLPSGSTLVVFSDLFGKSESNILSFKNASMTFCDDEDPHWKINASRMWLLSGGEFAFLNALLYVGKFPVLYLPAFYYPKDELIFNPAFGFQSKNGYYVQTTTYLHGRKGLGNSSSLSSSSEDEGDKALESLYSFMSPSTLKQQKREGIVLHNLDEDFSGDTNQYVKLIADWYSNLGYITGIEGNLQPKNDYISKLVFGLDLGWTTAIFNGRAGYTNLDTKGLKYWESSNFLSLKLPFRYKGNFEISINKPIRISLSLPLYSDPFFGNQLTNRNETLNWIGAVKEFLESDTDNSSTSSEVSSFAWNLNMSYSPNLPAIIKPYINSVSLSSSSSVNISSVNADKEKLTLINGEEWAGATAQRRFYYPSQIVPWNGNASISGTLFKYSSSNSQKSNVSKAQVSPAFELQKPENILDIDAGNGQKSENETTASDTSEKEKEEETTESLPEDFYFENFKRPDFSSGVSSGQRTIPGLEYSLAYSITPNFSSQLAYASEGLKTPEDFEWDNIRSSMYTFKMPVSLNSSMSYGGSFLSLSNKVSYDPVWQDHPYISTNTSKGGYTESQIKSMRKTDYATRKQDIVNTNSLSFRPFAYLPFLSDTNISWNSNVKLFRRTFVGDDENTLWENHFPKWDEETITVHTLNMNLSASEFDNKLKQSLNFSAALPPLEDKYTVSASFSFPYVSASLGTGFYKTKDQPDLKFNPLSQSLSFSYKLLGSNFSVSESYNYNFEEKKHDSFRTSVSWYGASLSYSMSDANTYDFDSITGWTQKDEKSFVPYSLSASYSAPSKTFMTWQNRVSCSLSLSTSVVADLIRPTNSYFLFTPSLSLKINQFMTLSFSSSSKNSVIYRYFQEMMGHKGRIPGETNPLLDLANSFRFDNKKLREASGFKLKSLDISMDHELHDWRLNFSCKVEPRLKSENGKKFYNFNPYISVGVIWSPMANIKTTTIIDENGEWKLD